MQTYDLIIDQHVRYWLQVEAETPEAAIAQVETEPWDDKNNVIVSDVVQVFPEGGLNHMPPKSRLAVSDPNSRLIEE